MKLYDFTEEEIREMDAALAVEQDIPEVKESKFTEIKNWFKSRKNRQIEEPTDDIPVVKESRIEKIRTWFNKKKEERDLKNENQISIKNEIKKLKTEKKEIKKQNRQTKIDNIKTWFNNKTDNMKTWFSKKKEERKLKKQEKQELKANEIYTKGDLVKSTIKCAVLGALSCLSMAGAFISAASVFSIGFMPALLAASCLVVSAKMFNHFFNDEFEKHGIIADYRNSKKTDEVKSEDLEGQAIDVNDLVVAKEVTNTKQISTKDEKIAKIKEECQLRRIKINDITSYCLLVAKEDVKLQKFIRSEYRKENPEEKIQSFELGDKKVLVLKNRPNFK